MHPFLFEIYGLSASSYGFFMILGVVAAWFLVSFLAGKDDKIVSIAFAVCVCGAFVGAFLFRPITRLPELIIHWEEFQGASIGVVMGYLFGEIVFYGGLIGAGISLAVFCRITCVSLPRIADLFAPAVAIAHAFGRVGCFLAGCCYGVPVQPSHPLAVKFPDTVIGGAPSGEPLLAVQLIEAVCLLVITAILVFVYKKTAPTGGANGGGATTGAKPKSYAGITVCVYGILYSAVRFILEFYRGDMIRGVYGPFSTSQYVSIVIFCLSVFLLVKIITLNRRATVH